MKIFIHTRQYLINYLFSKQRLASKPNKTYV